MRKIMLALAMLSMLLVAALPVWAQEADPVDAEVTLEDILEAINGLEDDNDGDLDEDILGDIEDLEDAVALLEDVDEDADGVPAIEELEIEQDIESGDVTQNYDISNSGDNSNQCVGLNSVGNTGNAASEFVLVPVGDSDGDGETEFSLEEVGADVSVDGTSTTECNQTVDQDANALSY